jgi:hypothetical protein
MPRRVPIGTSFGRDDRNVVRRSPKEIKPPARRIELESDAPASGQTAELAQRFVARHATWMPSDRPRVKIEPLAGKGWP